MSENKLRDILPDIKYRILMLKLSRQLCSSEDIHELTYILTSKIPDGIKERLTTPLKVFEFLHKNDDLGPTKLYWLYELFQEMDKPDLSAMVLNFFEHDKEMES